MRTVQRLTAAHYGIHFADQVALVATPLVAALAFSADPQTIGLLVAAQSCAHLVGSIPFGILIDRAPLRTLTIAAALTSAIGLTLAAIGLVHGLAILFAGGITLAGFGTVLFGLTTLSILPRAVPAASLARANASIQIPRTLCSFAAPLAVGLTIDTLGPVLPVTAAALAAILAVMFSLALPSFGVETTCAEPILKGIRESGRFVLHHRLLRPIMLCAVLWNLAFAALLVVLVPAIGEVYRFDPGSFGLALSAFGLAGVAGSWLSGRVAERVEPRVILVAGPGSSVAAAAGLIQIGFAPAEAWLHACLFLLGFGPSMWLVAQNSVRQVVSPPALLGRVNAVIQTAIYGVRPLGALLGGGIAGAFGPHAGLGFVFVVFTLSFAVAWFSDLAGILSYASLRDREAER